MDSRIDETIKKRNKGYNCAQAVACTYSDLVGMDEETIFKLTEALGSGMGNMEGTCGAVSSACILAGLKNSSGNLNKPDSKASTYSISKEILNTFKEQNGSVICRELKGIDTGKPLKSCVDCIKNAAEIAEKVVFKD